MSNLKLRKNKRCENCGHFVEKQFCPNCGQENMEMRQAFYHLFVHFVADFFHYDGKFWKTTRYLLFSPAKLTQEYLAGRRKSYVNPVQLYIFISFIAFFIPSVLPNFNKHSEQQSIEKRAETTPPDDIENKTEASEQTTVRKSLKNGLKNDLKDKKIRETIKHHLSKAIFFYMPVFAFWLWVFHKKKKWLYFDHSIYTLHYFSYLLLIVLLFILTQWILAFFHGRIARFIDSVVTLVVFGYSLFYFFRSHSRFYQESKAVSRTKCILLSVINSIGIILFLLLFLLYIALSVHYKLIT